jgi:hypothetical protein
VASGYSEVLGLFRDSSPNTTASLEAIGRFGLER